MGNHSAINEIRRNIRYGDTKKAISIFDELLEGRPGYDDFILQAGRWTSLEKEFREGLVTREQWDVGTVNFHKNLIYFAQEMEGEQGNTGLNEDARNYPVNVYFFACDFDITPLKNQIIKQNKQQDIFEFQIINWPLWEGRIAFEEAIREQDFDGKLSFVDSVVEKVRQFPHQNRSENTIDLVVTSINMPKRFYTWANIPRDGIVISQGTLREIFEFSQDTINDLILKVIQRMAIYALNIPDLKAHEATKGCVFDLTVDIRDLKNSIEINYLCRECEGIIASSEKGRAVLSHINKWVDNLILNQ